MAFISIIFYEILAISLHLLHQSFCSTLISATPVLQTGTEGAPRSPAVDTWWPSLASRWATVVAKDGLLVATGHRATANVESCPHLPWTHDYPWSDCSLLLLGFGVVVTWALPSWILWLADFFLVKISLPLISSPLDCPQIIITLIYLFTSTIYTSSTSRFVLRYLTLQLFI